MPNKTAAAHTAKKPAAARTPSSDSRDAEVQGATPIDQAQPAPLPQAAAEVPATQEQAQAERDALADKAASAVEAAVQASPVLQAMTAATRARPGDEKLAVTYVGKAPYVDRLYGTLLDFEPGQTRELPSATARKFLRHTDVFEQASPAKAVQKAEKELDDTVAKLQEAERKKALERAQQNRRQDLVDRVNAMDEATLRDFAKATYNQELDGRLGLEKVREAVLGFVDQFGAE